MICHFYLCFLQTLLETANLDAQWINAHLDGFPQIAAVARDWTPERCEPFTGIPAAQLRELVHAYAISVHKSQGAEYPVVVIPLLTQHYMMLQRNLLYTAITRGKKLVVIVGSRRALDVALKNDRPKQRLSGLQQRLAC